MSCRIRVSYAFVIVINLSRIAIFNRCTRFTGKVALSSQSFPFLRGYATECRSDYY